MRGLKGEEVRDGRRKGGKGEKSLGPQRVTRRQKGEEMELRK